MNSAMSRDGIYSVAQQDNIGELSHEAAIVPD